MLFNSISYLLFLPLVFVLYWLLKENRKLQNLLLLVASYYFYGFWSIGFLGLLAMSTLLDYGYGFLVGSKDRSIAKIFLVLSILNNLGILAVFKYYNFFMLEVQASAAYFGWQFSPLLLSVALPVGISFYTFHGMSYVFDIYRGIQKPVRSYVDYAVFVSFFPLLVAGPIERAQHLLPQVQRARTFQYQQQIQGLRLILWGFFKKLVIADTLAAKIVDPAFSDPSAHAGIGLILAVIAFSFQIYCDFSGYTDIALGSAKLLGFELLSNFKFPYFSRNIPEFWTRWHISLSSWFRDYVYIPLGGSRHGRSITIRNVIVVFLLSGFWHGANWTFIFWGALHALGFLPKVWSSKSSRDKTKNRGFNAFLSILGTFLFISFAWIFFRAETLAAAFRYLGSIWNNFWVDSSFLLDELKELRPLLIVIPFLFVEHYLQGGERNLRVPKNLLVRWVVYLVLGIFVLLNFSSNTNFIYFQF